MSVTCDKYGFFNGIYGIEQTNWSNYWKGVVPDGVVANSGSGDHKEMEVYPIGGMYVGIGTGECMVDNHKAWLTSPKSIAISARDEIDDRIDTVVLRVVYGNIGESLVEVDVVQGEPLAENPVPPTLTQITGEVYEYGLANIYVESAQKSSNPNITDTDITDVRFVFSLGSGSVSFFEETRTVDSETGDLVRFCELTVVDGREYRATNTITNTFEITLPENPTTTFMCGVNFTTATETEDETTFEFQGVTFKRGGNEYTVKTQDQFTIVGVRYNIIIWWDGAYYWAAARAA